MCSLVRAAIAAQSLLTFTAHQPWEALIRAGLKQDEFRRGAIRCVSLPALALVRCGRPAPAHLLELLSDEHRGELTDAPTDGSVRTVVRLETQRAVSTMSVYERQTSVPPVTGVAFQRQTAIRLSGVWHIQPVRGISGNQGFTRTTSSDHQLLLATLAPVHAQAADPLQPARDQVVEKKASEGKGGSDSDDDDTPLNAPKQQQKQKKKGAKGAAAEQESSEPAFAHRARLLEQIKQARRGNCMIPRKQLRSGVLIRLVRKKGRTVLKESMLPGWDPNQSRLPVIECEPAGPVPPDFKYLKDILPANNRDFVLSEQPNHEIRRFKWADGSHRMGARDTVNPRWGVWPIPDCACVC